MELNNYSYAAHKDNTFYKLLTRSYTFQLAKYEHDGVSKTIDSDDRNFSFIGLGELLFLKCSRSRRLYFELTRATNAGLTTLKYLLF